MPLARRGNLGYNGMGGDCLRQNSIKKTDCNPFPSPRRTIFGSRDPWTQVHRYRRVSLRDTSDFSWPQIGLVAVRPRAAVVPVPWQSSDRNLDFDSQFGMIGGRFDS